MRVWSLIKNNFIHNLVWTEGRNILIVIFGLGLFGYFLAPWLIYLALFFFLFSFYFFRNPERICTQALADSSFLICPADGKVVAIEQVDDPVFTQKIAIFLSPFDVHVQWAPAAGQITEVLYHKGQFAMAFLPKSSELNERNDVIIKMNNGTLLKVRQISGTIARVIVCWVKKNELIKAGFKYGMIKFGSRVELFVPPSVTIELHVGQRVHGGQTIIGRVRA